MNGRNAVIVRDAEAVVLCGRFRRVQRRRCSYDAECHGKVQEGSDSRAEGDDENLGRAAREDRKGVVLQAVRALEI
jgi:hypothetical protein